MQLSIRYYCGIMFFVCIANVKLLQFIIFVINIMHYSILSFAERTNSLKLLLQHFEF